VFVLSLVTLPRAEAKCVRLQGCPTITSVRAVISGPGIHPRIVMRGEAFWELAQWSGVSGRERSFSQYVEPELPDEQALGPRYRVRFVVRVKGGGALVVVQDLYPYTPVNEPSGLQAAWTFTPRDERFVADYGAFFEEYPIVGGWWRSTVLFDTLVAHGLPEAPPVPVRDSTGGAADVAVAAVSPGSGWSNGASVAVGSLLLIFLVALLIRASVRFRSRAPNP
jgi:hypothetical protein